MKNAAPQPDAFGARNLVAAVAVRSFIHAIAIRAIAIIGISNSEAGT